MTIQMNTTRADASPIRLVIHGGAGSITRSKLKKELEQAYTQVLAQSLLLAMQCLKQAAAASMP
jgi:L-asparaginase / beta-aspartyl-peptidase